MGVALNILMAAYFFHNKFDQGQKEALFISALDFTNNSFPDKPKGEVLKNNESTRYLIFAMILSTANESTNPFIDENWINFENQADVLGEIDLFANFNDELQQAQAYLYQKYSIFVPYKKHDGTAAITDTYIAHLAKQEQDGTIDNSGKEVLRLMKKGNRPSSSTGCLSVFSLIILCVPVLISFL
jgi:hypothetical protein